MVVDQGGRLVVTAIPGFKDAIEQIGIFADPGRRTRSQPFVKRADFTHSESASSNSAVSRTAQQPGFDGPAARPEIFRPPTKALVAPIQPSVAILLEQLLGVGFQGRRQNQAG